MTNDTRTFEVDRSFATLSKWAPWILIAFALLSVALPFLPNGDRPSNNFGIIGLSVFGVVFFGALGWYGFRVSKQLPQCSVSVDRDGLWPAHLSKEKSQVRWEDVYSTSERMYLQRLDLLDKNGNVLIKVEYQLSGFETLRALLLEKISTPTQTVGSGRFAKRPIYHVFHVGSIAGFSALGWYVGASNPLLGYGGMAILVGLIAHEYFTTVSSIEVFRDRLQLAFPFKTQVISRTQIEAVQIGDLINRGVRHPEIGLFIRGKEKPIRLRGLGIDAVKLHQILEQWRHDTR